jgi:FkbM family methyltransferase
LAAAAIATVVKKISECERIVVLRDNPFQVMTVAALHAFLRLLAINALFRGLRFYTAYSPFKRGRGFFIRTIELLKRRGWPSPLSPIGDGLVMEFEPSLLGWTIFERGDWEPEQTAIVLKLLHPGAVVLDVGANTGYYALIAARAVGSSNGKVHAFEIQPRIVEILRRNIALNGFRDIITVVEAGCFSKRGEATIDAPGDAGSARISFAHTGIRVPLITLDHYAADKALGRVDLLIIDAEGADFEILKGAADVLRRFHPIVMAEVHHLAAFGGSEQEMCAFMSDLGYAVRAVQSEFSRDLLFLPPID